MDIIKLILEIIRLILGGENAKNAVGVVSKNSGKGFDELWEHLPDKYK